MPPGEAAELAVDEGLPGGDALTVTAAATIVGATIPDPQIIRYTDTQLMSLVSASRHILRRTLLTYSLSRSSLNVGQLGAVARVSTAAPFPRQSSSRSLA